MKKINKLLNQKCKVCGQKIGYVTKKYVKWHQCLELCKHLTVQGKNPNLCGDCGADLSKDLTEK